MGKWSGVDRCLLEELADCVTNLGRLCTTDELGDDDGRQDPRTLAHRVFDCRNDLACQSGYED